MKITFKLEHPKRNRSAVSARVYHEFWKEQQGSETSPTLLFTYNEEKPFHIDYCFGSDWFVQRMTSMTVGKASDWLKLSDHMPLEVEFQLG